MGVAVGGGVGVVKVRVVVGDGTNRAKRVSEESAERGPLCRPR
jgi:hypothetical protein